MGLILSALKIYNTVQTGYEQSIDRVSSAQTYVENIGDSIKERMHKILHRPRIDSDRIKSLSNKARKRICEYRSRDIHSMSEMEKKYI